jgi:3-isopropylmalate dehydrogenase
MFKKDYSVLVAENMFGDIVSDLCAGLVGGLGFAPSANLGDNYAVFEPTHGSAPKYAGQYKVNPIAMLLTTKLMHDWLKETDKAKRLEDAIAKVIAEGKVRTYDMSAIGRTRRGEGGKASTLGVAKAIADYASS